MLEYVAAALNRDQGFTDEGRRAVLAALRERFADYGVKVIRPDESDVRVLMRMVIEGALDNAEPARIAEVAFAAYQAVSRGADPEVVEGIGLYGYRKQIPGETLAMWANGFNEATKGGVPADVAADLVRNSMEHDWDPHTFNTFKWSLVEAQRRRFDLRRYAAFLFQKMEAGKEGPGAITAGATTVFTSAKRQNREVPIADYHGVFVLSKEPPAPPAPEAPVETASASPDGRVQADQERAEAEQAAQAAAGTSRADGKGPTPVSQGGTQLAPLPARASARLAKVWPDLDAAVRRYLGTPYVWGGETAKGIDCSGLTQRSYYEGAKVGIPRNSRQQWKTGRRVDYDKLQEGDLVFFNTLGNGVSHVGMMVDAHNARFIHASSSKGVTLADLGQQWFRKRYLGARRVLAE